MSAESNRAIVNEAESNVQGSNPEASNSALIPQPIGDEMKQQ